MANPTIPSKYLPAWNTLKKDGLCRLVAPKEHHKTIIKAIRNARDDDLGFRLQLEESNKKHIIKATRQESMITFKLILLLKPIGL